MAKIMESAFVDADEVEKLSIISSDSTKSKNKKSAQEKEFDNGKDKKVIVTNKRLYILEQSGELEEKTIINIENIQYVKYLKEEKKNTKLFPILFGLLLALGSIAFFFFENLKILGFILIPVGVIILIIGLVCSKAKPYCSLEIGTSSLPISINVFNLLPADVEKIQYDIFRIIEGQK